MNSIDKERERKYFTRDMYDEIYTYLNSLEETYIGYRIYYHDELNMSSQNSY